MPQPNLQFIHSSTFVRFGVAATLLFAIVGCAEVETNIDSETAPLIGGSTVSSDVYPAAGALVAESPWSDDVYHYCSGVLIAPDVVLTAGHCLVPPDWFPDLKLSFTLAADIHDPEAQFIASRRSHVHPGYDDTRPGDEPLSDLHDIGILILETPILDVKPAPIATLAADLFVGLNTEAIGYGLSDPDDQDTAGIRRFGSDTISEISNGEFLLSEEGTQHCFGDSGGPIFAASSSSAGKVLGVVSRGEGDNGDTPCLPEDGEIDTRVDTHASWIRDASGIDAVEPGACVVQAQVDNIKYRLRSDPSTGLMDSWTRFVGAFSFQWIDIADERAEGALARWALSMNGGAVEFTAEVPVKDPVDLHELTYQRGTVNLATSALEEIPAFDYDACVQTCRRNLDTNLWHNCAPGCQKRAGENMLARLAYFQGTATLDDGVRAKEATIWVSKNCVHGSKADDFGEDGLDVDIGGNDEPFDFFNSEESAGCSVTHGNTAAATWFVLVLGLMMSLRRRRRNDSDIRLRRRRLVTTIAAIAVVAFLVPTLASAQPGPPPGPNGAGPGGPPPGPGGPGAAGPAFGKRLGLTWGFDVALGAMTSEQVGSIDCANCDFQPISGGFGGHVGLQVTPSLSISADLRGTGQLISSNAFEDAYLFQTTFMGVAKYHLAPRLWIQGGLGVANLAVTVDDGYTQGDETVDNGGAAMAAVGYEIANNRRMSIDLSFRVVTAAYDGIGDSIQSVMFGLDFNFHPRPRIRVYRQY